MGKLLKRREARSRARMAGFTRRHNGLDICVIEHARPQSIVAIVRSSTDGSTTAGQCCSLAVSAPCLGLRSHLLSSTDISIYLHSSEWTTFTMYVGRQPVRGIGRNVMSLMVGNSRFLFDVFHGVKVRAGY